MVRILIPAMMVAATTLSVPMAVQAQTGTKVISDQILPQDTYFYLSVPNVRALRGFVESSSMGQLWADPEFDAFKGEIENAFGSDLEEGLAQVEEVLGMTFWDLLDIPDGEMSLAFSACPGNAGAREVMGAVVFLDFGARGAEVQSLLDKAVDFLARAPMLNQENTSFDDTEITLFKIQHNGPAPTPLAKEFGWFIRDQRLVISNQSALLESAISNWDGDSSDTFRNNETYSYILQRCGADDGSGLTTLFFDPVGLVTKLIQTGSLGARMTGGASMAMLIVPQLGLDQMRAIGSVSKPGSGDFEAVTRTVFYADQPPRALMQLFQLEPMDTIPPSWVKENATAYAAAKWKISDAFNAIEAVADSFAPGVLAARLDEMATRDPGIHIKSDIIDQLTGELRFVTAPGDGGSIGGDQLVMALGVKDSGAVADVLSKAADEAGLEIREFRGSTVHEMVIPGGEGQALAVTVHNGMFLFGMGTSLLDQILRNDSDVRPLSETEDFQKVAQHVPRNALSMQFTRPAEQYRSIYEAVRSGTAADQFPGSQDFFEMLDFTTLPPFDVIAKYVHPTGGYTIQDDNGFFMEAFQLRD